MIDSNVYFASLLPVCVFACLVALGRCDSAALSEYRARKTLSKQGIYDLFFLLVAVSLMLAALRGTSHLGLWGAGFTGSPVSSFMGYAVVGMVLFAFAYLTLIRNSNNQMLVRFQPAFLVLAAGFVLYVLQDSFLVVPGYAQFFEWLYLTVELFGHLLSGTLIIAANDASLVFSGRKRFGLWIARDSLDLLGAGCHYGYSSAYGNCHFPRYGCNYSPNEYSPARD